MKNLFADLKKEGRLIWRGIKTIHSLQPYMLLVSFSAGIFASINPFIGMYFSSLIITELMLPARDIKHILYLAILTVVLTFLCRLILNFLYQMLDTLQYVLGHKKELDLSNKGYELDYADMDDVKIRQMREKLERDRYYKGIIALVYQIRWITSSILSIIFSVALVAEMLKARSPKSSQLSQFVNSPIAAILLCLLIGGTIYYSTRNASIINKKYFEITDKLAPHYNSEHFFSFLLATEYNAGKDIRLYNQKALIEKELGFHLDKIFNMRKILPELDTKFSCTESALKVLVTLVTYLFVGLKALTGAFGVGNIVLYTGAVTQLGQNLSDFLYFLTEMRRNSEYLTWYFEFLDLPNRKESGNLPLEAKTAKDAIIEFKNVSFKYPGSEHYSLKNISIRFNAKERIAVVGKNGSGKTTFIKLLCRLYDPTEGEILLNGINIKDYKYEDYLAAFSVVFQDFKLFSFTLGENVAIASDYEEGKVTECINQAGLKERMAQFPDDLHTQLYNEFSEDGIEISGGEAQKIAIARALYKDAPFIILDEPTAALDPIAEADIYARLNDMIQDKTAIYISHRLSSCCFCNQIAVFDQGELIQYGKHKDLLEDTADLYYELWNAQAQYYT